MTTIKKYSNRDNKEEKESLKVNKDNNTNNKSKINFSEKDIKAFKSTINRIYIEDLEKYGDIIKDYGKEFDIPKLSFNQDKSKTDIEQKMDPELNSSILAAYNFKSNEIRIKPELLNLYLGSNKDISIIDHTLAHELGHAISMQFGPDNYKNKSVKDKNAYDYVKDELLANLFAAQLSVKKKGLQISNETISKQLIADDTDFKDILKNIDKFEKYLNDLEDYQKNLIQNVKEFSKFAYDKIKEISDDKKIKIDITLVGKINKIYLDRVKLELNNFFKNSLANYSILTYSAPLLGASISLSKQNIDFKDFMNKIFDNISSVKEIKKYIKGSAASLNLRILSPIEFYLIDIEARKALTDELVKGDEFRDTYPQAFLKMEEQVENEFISLNVYLNAKIESERKVLKDLIEFNEKLKIN